MQLSDATWANLALEYDFALDPAFHGEPGWVDLQAIRNADALRDFVVSRTRLDANDDGEVTDIWVTYTFVSWEPVEDDTPYPDFEAMVTAWKEAHWTPLKLQVSDLWHNHPVFTREDNLRFRVWHDTAHLEAGLGFSNEDEVELFKIQAQQIHNGLGHPDYCRSVVDALFCESVYQLAWCRVNGGYPDHQVVRTPGPVGRALLDAWGL